MIQTKNTKRALLISILSVLVCCAMLIGITFAWFTDSVTSGNNTIVAGNLDVELYHTSASVTEEEKVMFVAFLNGTHAFVDNYTELIEYCKKDPNIWYTTHNYSPYQFTLENGRTHIDSATGEYIYYPFDEEIETETKSVINTLYEQEIEHGIDYWVGEWGVYDNVKHEDRVAYHKTSAEKYRQLGIAWCKWELFAGFAIYNGPNDTWDEELIAALFS